MKGPENGLPTPENTGNKMPSKTLEEALNRLKSNPKIAAAIERAKSEKKEREQDFTIEDKPKIQAPPPVVKVVQKTQPERKFVDYTTPDTPEVEVVRDENGKVTGWQRIEEK